MMQGCQRHVTKVFEIMVRGLRKICGPNFLFLICCNCFCFCFFVECKIIVNVIDNINGKVKIPDISAILRPISARGTFFCLECVFQFISDVMKTP